MSYNLKIYKFFVEHNTIIETKFRKPLIVCIHNSKEMKLLYLFTLPFAYTS